MKSTIITLIATWFAISVYAQKPTNTDVALEISREIHNAYPELSWNLEWSSKQALMIKTGVAVAHEQNNSQKFLDLVTLINSKIESIGNYRIFSDRQNDDKGIRGRYVVSVRPDEDDIVSTLFYSYKRMNHEQGQKDSISFIFCINMGTSPNITQDIHPGIRSMDDSSYTKNQPSSEKYMKPIEDFFQEQYNDQRAIRRQAFYKLDGNSAGQKWACKIIYNQQHPNPTISTNAIFSQRPVTDSSDFEALLQVAKQYRRSSKCDLSIQSGNINSIIGQGLILNFTDKDNLPVVYHAVLENNVFSIMKATGTTPEGFCIASYWWR